MMANRIGPRYRRQVSLFLILVLAGPFAFTVSATAVPRALATSVGDPDDPNEAPNPGKAAAKIPQRTAGLDYCLAKTVPAEGKRGRLQSAIQVLVRGRMVQFIIAYSRF
jgi:hypothetical protein